MEQWFPRTKGTSEFFKVWGKGEGAVGKFHGVPPYIQIGCFNFLAHILFMLHCTESMSNTKVNNICFKNSAYGRHWISWHLQIVAPKRPHKNTTEHPAHQGSATPRNTLLTMDLPTAVHPTHRWLVQRWTPLLPWICPTGEHLLLQTHRWPAPRRDTIITGDLPQCRLPGIPFPTLNSLLTQREKTFKTNCAWWHNNTKHMDIATYRLNRHRRGFSKKQSVRKELSPYAMFLNSGKIIEKTKQSKKIPHMGDKESLDRCG